MIIIIIITAIFYLILISICKNIFFTCSNGPISNVEWRSRRQLFLELIFEEIIYVCAFYVYRYSIIYVVCESHGNR